MESMNPAQKSPFACLNGSKRQRLNKKALAVLIHCQSGRPDQLDQSMKKLNRVRRNGSAPAAAQQVLTPTEKPTSVARVIRLPFVFVDSGSPHGPCLAIEMPDGQTIDITSIGTQSFGKEPTPRVIGEFVIGAVREKVQRLSRPSVPWVELEEAVDEMDALAAMLMTHVENPPEAGKWASHIICGMLGVVHRSTSNLRRLSTIVTKAAQPIAEVA